MQRNIIQATIILSVAVAITALCWSMMQSKTKGSESIPVFEPTNEWKEVLPGQAIPKVGMRIANQELGAEGENGLQYAQEIRQAGRWSG